MTIKDAAITWDNTNQYGDLTVSSNDLTSDDGVVSAVLISLLTDKRAEDDEELPDPLSTDRRGWWADQIDDDQIGSSLWLLERSKTTKDVLISAKRYAEESLQWMIDDGLAETISVEVEKQGPIENYILALKIVIYLVDQRYIDILLGYSPEAPDGGIDYLYVGGEKIWSESSGSVDYFTFGEL